NRLLQCLSWPACGRRLESRSDEVSDEGELHAKAVAPGFGNHSCLCVAANKGCPIFRALAGGDLDARLQWLGSGSRIAHFYWDFANSGRTPSPRCSGGPVARRHTQNRAGYLSAYFDDAARAVAYVGAPARI